MTPQLQPTREPGQLPCPTSEHSLLPHPSAGYTTGLLQLEGLGNTITNGGAQPADYLIMELSLQPQNFEAQPEALPKHRV